jgi:hypothetical protein
MSFMTILRIYQPLKRQLLTRFYLYNNHNLRNTKIKLLAQFRIITKFLCMNVMISIQMELE